MDDWKVPLFQETSMCIHNFLREPVFHIRSQKYRSFVKAYKDSACEALGSVVDGTAETLVTYKQMDLGNYYTNYWPFHSEK